MSEIMPLNSPNDSRLPTPDRFLVVISRSEQVMMGLGRYPDDRGPCGLAQAYDFALSQPDLVAAGLAARAAADLEAALKKSKAPPEILDIYRELYPEVLAEVEPKE